MPPQSLEIALSRPDTVVLTLEEVDLKYVSSFVPADAAVAAADANFAQFDRAVRTALSLVPVQLDPTTVRLTTALLTWAAIVPSMVMESWFDS